MRKLGILGLLFALLAVSAPSAKAQTTYTLNKPFTCDSVSAYPITSWSEFTCRINNPVPYPVVLPNFLDANGHKAALYVWASLPRLYVEPPAWSTTNASFQLTNFTTPLPSGCGRASNPCTTPGAFAFNWSGTDTNGNPYSGTVSGTWISEQICGGRGCYWFAPVLEPGTMLTVN